MPMNRSKYPSNWPEISKAIREREGQRCLVCGAPNGQVIVRSVDGSEYLTTDDGCEFRRWDAETGADLGAFNPHCYDDFYRPGGTRVVLTVAHIDHDTTNNEPWNLAALCQAHHLRWDREQHRATRARNRRARLAVGELFSEGAKER